MTFVGVLWLHRLADDGRGGATYRMTGRQRWQLAGAVGSLAVAVGWPVAGLAAHWSLTALLLQRLLIVLVTAPLLLLALPTPALARLTRPALVDAAVDFLSRPAVAIVTFTVVVVGTLSTGAVGAQAGGGGWRAFFDVLLLFAGIVLWIPVFGRVPGPRRMSPVGKAVYLLVQSVLPNFPAVVFVFSRHPLYAAFAHAHRAIGLSALNDQQLAGIVAKVGTLPVLWSSAWRALSRAERVERLGVDEEPLTWAEVERAMERGDRAARRSRPVA
ncbi:MAG: cytochrome c oxidase assembly protein [Acidobacteriota bacterium]|nr:cytochrome c oxidase assembly protein [Acidobacteriota bacterium]